MIHNEAELREWIDGHPSRHHGVEDGLCSCGWREDETGIILGVRLHHHIDAMVVADLADVLESNYDGMSWSSAAADRDEVIDLLHKAIDELQERTGERADWSIFEHRG